MEKEFEVAKSSKKQKRIDFSIKTSSYHAQVNFLENNVVFLNKFHHYKQGTYYQTYGSDWAVSFANLPAGKVKLRCGKQKIPLSGNTLIFHAPFSILEFEVQRCDLQWGFVGSDILCPVTIDQAKVVTQATLDYSFTQKNIIDMLRTLKSGISIEQQKTNSIIADKVKKKMDQSYDADINISELSNELKYSRVVASRAFTQAYGISLIDYRNRLRIHGALSYMRQGLSITDASYLVGFSNPGLFINNFKSYLNATPHQYKSKARV